jgi:hypothetical protein
MPDSSLGDLVANEVGQNVFAWAIHQAARAPRVAQVAMLGAAALAALFLVAGRLLYPGTAAFACFAVGGILLAAIVLTLFTIAVIRGE